MKFTIFQDTRIGNRKYNQDRLAHSYSRDALMLVVADGMGGHLHGEVAAQITVQLMVELFQQQAKPLLTDPVYFLLNSIHRAHQAIIDYSEHHNLLEAPRTTVVACVVQANQVNWAHVGDSRFYLFHKQRLVLHTHDHSRVYQMVRQGQITEEESRRHPDRNKIYNCLGSHYAPDVELSRRVPIERGDTLLLCSDGLWGPLPTTELARIMTHGPVNQTVPQLAALAQKTANGTSDNISAIGVTWDSDHVEGGRDDISTLNMGDNTVNTHLEDFQAASTGATKALSDDEIEAAIAEIQAAIKKYTK